MSERIGKIRAIVVKMAELLEEVRAELRAACFHDPSRRERGADSDGPYEFCKDCGERLV